MQHDLSIYFRKQIGKFDMYWPQLQYIQQQYGDIFDLYYYN